ncbi:type 1 fimbrial protein [Escherichia coli]|nr:type 1 fimbrial protein [Escherichia coli]
MFKGQKTLAALAISLLFASPVFAADEGSGEIHFKGEVIEAPCEIHPDDLDMNIDLGEVTTSHINREHHSEKKPVNIRLINCDIAGWDDGKGGVVSKVGVTFDSTAKTTGATPLLSNISAGEATGVGVRLMNKDESFSTEQTLNFFAWMEQMDNAVSVTAGAVTANATYVLDYQ